MQQTNTTASSPASASFAGLLAALAAPSNLHGDFADVPAPKKRPAHIWNDDDLADDVATLSYERALRTHARYRAPAVEPALTAASGRKAALNTSIRAAADPCDTAAAEENLSTHVPATAQPAPRPRHDSVPGTGQMPTGPFARSPLERNLKDASITIRMSQAESAQLHRRAAEAGLTVSAYLRSCTFEAESLRAEVKKALLELKAGAVLKQPESQEPSPDAAPRRAGLGRLAIWLAHVLTPWSAGTHALRA